MEQVLVRPADREDLPAIADMCHLLWPDATAEDHARDLTSYQFTDRPGTLPAAILLACDVSGTALGFIEVGLRSHADGCDPARPVGYIEGWYVAPGFRRHTIGSQLMAAAENWARTQGCLEMASDTWLDNLQSQCAHEALGFEIVDRCVQYRKRL